MHIVIINAYKNAAMTGRHTYINVAFSLKSIESLFNVDLCSFFMALFCLNSHFPQKTS